MNKTIILPILTTLALVVGTFTGKTIDESVIEQLASGIFAIVTLWGIFKNHKKEDK